MKLKTLAILVFCGVFAVTHAQAQEFVLNGVTHCGGNLTNPGAGVHFNLAAGTHEIEWVSGAYSLWSSDGQNGGNTWVGVARAYIYETDETVTFGNGGGFFATSALAAAGAVGIHPITLSVPSQVSFYVSDGGGCGDNRGNITLRFVAPVATETSTWGGIKALYR